MKIRRLPEVELANLTVLPLDEQRRRMTKLASDGGGIFSFEPTREQFPDILNSQPELFRSLGPTPITEFPVIAAKLRKRCKPGIELEFNLLVAKMLYGHFRAENAVSREFFFSSLPVGLDRSVRFWISAYYARDGLPVLTFIDPRGGRNLTARGRNVVFSGMHFGIRERYPDFAESLLQIVQVPYLDKPRGAKVHRDREIRHYDLSGDPVFSFEQLDEMLTRTLLLWDEVCASVAEETRKRAGEPGTLI